MEFQVSVWNWNLWYDLKLIPLLESLQKDIDRWTSKNGVYEKDELCKPEVKILDEFSNHSKIFEIIGHHGELISFGHILFEIIFSVKLQQS